MGSIGLMLAAAIAALATVNAESGGTGPEGAVRHHQSTAGRSRSDSRRSASRRGSNW